MKRTDSSGAGPNREVVLDTHVVLWWFSDSARLSPSATAAIHDATTITVSAISMWEIAMLVGKQRIALDRPVVAWMRSLGEQPRVRVLPVTGEIAVRAVELTDLHGDPAARLIAAATLDARADLITKDSRLLDWAAPRTDVRAIW